MQTFILMNPLF